MDMDKKELKFINSSFRNFFLKNYEFRVFRRFLKDNNIDLINKVILDAGCSTGYGTYLIEKEFEPKELCAFDIMPQQVKLAKRRNLKVDIFVGDINDIKLPSNKFDAVFIFGILHHDPNWHEALKEVYRVLKLDGILLVEEPDKKTLDEREKFLKISHPKDSRFEWNKFASGLVDAGFYIVEVRDIYFKHFRSFMCMKSEKF